MADCVDQWIDECGRTLAEAQRCAERLARAGRGDEAAALGARLARLRTLVERARRERAIEALADKIDPQWMNPRR